MNSSIIFWILTESWPNSDLKSSNGSVPRGSRSFHIRPRPATRPWSSRSLQPARTRTGRVRPLVERFDVEPFSDFSAKWANFIGLALFCIDAKFWKKIFDGKLLTKSTRFTCFCTAQTSIFQKNYVKLFPHFFGMFFCKKSLFLNSFRWVLLRFWWTFIGISPPF